MEFPEGPIPVINSNRQDILLDDRPQFKASTIHTYADSDWATCIKTRRSFGGTCIRLAGGTIAYKCKFHPTVAGSSTEAEFMAAYNTGKMILFVRSIYGISTFHRWQLRSYLRTTMDVRQWAMLKNPLHVLVTLTSSTFHFANGSNAISCF